MYTKKTTPPKSSKSVNKSQEILRKFVNSNLSIPILLLMIIVPLYTHHLSPGVYGTDSGDFLSAALTKGVPHPSGYPLFTILGIIFLKLPIPATPAWKMGLISVFSSSASVVIFYLINLKTTKNQVVSLISSLMLAFTYPFWLYAEVVEVFALHNLFILLAIYISLELHKRKNTKYLYILSFILGISLTNNLSIILIFPAIAIFILVNKGLLKLILNFKVIVKCFLFFSLGLLPYIYIPIAARNDPYILWGLPVNLENFLFLVFRKKYGWGNLETSSFIPYDSIHGYIAYFNTYVSPLLPAFSLLGVISLIKKDFKIWSFFSITFIFLGPFYILYSRTSLENFTYIGVLERFYLSSIIVLMLFIAPGFSAVLQLLKNLLKNPGFRTITKTTAQSVFAIVPITFLIVNYQKTNLSNNLYYDNLGYEILTPLPKNSFLFFASDTYSFPSAYIRSAFNLRPDIKNPGENTGYKILLEEAGVIKKENIDSFLLENKNSLKKEVLTKAIAQLIDKGLPVYSEKNITFEDENVGKIVPVPFGLVFQLVKEEDRPNKDTFYKDYLPSFSHINPKFLIEDRLFGENAVLADLKILYSQFYNCLGNYLIDHYQDHKTGLDYIGKSLEYSIYLPTQKYLRLED